MAGIGRVLGFHVRAEAVTTDFLERAGKSAGVAGELHGRGVGEKFALTADGGLNETSKKNADAANGQ